MEESLAIGDTIEQVKTQLLDQQDVDDLMADDSINIYKVTVQKVEKGTIPPKTLVWENCNE